MTTFNWLHLTDMHLGMQGADSIWPSVEHEFLADIDYLVEQTGPLDLVLFTGDLTQSGAAKEFELVDRLLNRLWERFLKSGHQPPKFLAIPGNHDLVRPDPKSADVLVLTQMWDTVKQDFLHKPGCSQRKLIKKVFQNYTAWWESQGLPTVPAAHKPAACASGLLPGDFAATLVKDGFRFGVVGLNSTFLQLIGGDLTGKMALSVEQFHTACRNAGGEDGQDWARKHDVCFLLTHHPVDWLNSDSQEELNGKIHTPPELFALHLYGHMHESALVYLSLGGAPARRRLQGRSLFGMEGWGSKKEERRHGYSIGQLQIRAASTVMKIFPRAAQRQQDAGWSFDRDLSFALPKGSDATQEMEVVLLPSQPKPPQPPVDRDAKTAPDAARRQEPINNLFVPGTRMPEEPIGREREIAQVRALLHAGEDPARLITLLGENGVGKSLLAEYVVKDAFKKEQLNHFVHGVFHIDFKVISTQDVLNTASDWNRAVRFIADNIRHGNVSGSAVETSESLLNSLRGQRMLLLLDNFERVASGIPFIEQLLSSCPALTLILTSNERLSGQTDTLSRWEHLLNIGPLRLPEPGEIEKLEQLVTVPSVALLVKRAQQEEPTFHLTHANAQAIADICKLLNGLPLAIEVLASSVASTDPAALHQDLARQGLEQNDLPGKERLYRTLEWSYHSLSPAQQALFRRVAVFAGGATWDAIQTVFRDADYDPPLAASLGQLAHKRLLRFEAPRYSMLWVLQEYAQQKMSKIEVATMHAQHAFYYGRLVREAEPHLMSADRHGFLEALDEEYGNLRAIFQRSLKSSIDFKHGADLAGRLVWFWNLRGRFGEGRAVYEDFLQRRTAIEDTEMMARLYYGDGALAFLQGEYHYARRQLTNSVDAWSEGDNKRGLALALVILGMVKKELYADDLTEAYEDEKRSVAIFEELKDDWGLALALNDLGNIRVAQRQYTEANLNYIASEEKWSKLGDSWGLALTQSNRAFLAYLEKEYCMAQDFYQRALIVQQEEHDIWGIAWSFKGLGDVAAAQEDYRQAAQYYAESFALHWNMGRKQLISECLEGLATVALGFRQPDRAALLHGASRTLRTGRKAKHLEDAYEGRVAALRELLKNDISHGSFEILSARGQRWKPEEILQHVSDYLREWRA